MPKPYRQSFAIFVSILALLALGCARGGEEEEAPAPVGEQIPVVADSIIEAQVQASLDADPRLDEEGIQIEAHSTSQEVTLVGRVPSRFEMSIAREDAISVLGVKRVHLDSLIVESEMRGADAARQTLPGAGQAPPAEEGP